MPRHCCTTWGNAGCRANYTKDEAETTFQFPKDPYERQRWLDALPSQFQSDIEKAAVCEKHWPKGYPTTKFKRGHIRPSCSESILV